MCRAMTFQYEEKDFTEEEEIQEEKNNVIIDPRQGSLFAAEDIGEINPPAVNTTDSKNDEKTTEEDKQPVEASPNKAACDDSQKQRAAFNKKHALSDGLSDDVAAERAEIKELMKQYEIGFQPVSEELHLDIRTVRGEINGWKLAKACTRQKIYNTIRRFAGKAEKTYADETGKNWCKCISFTPDSMELLTTIGAAVWGGKIASRNNITKNDELREILLSLVFYTFEICSDNMKLFNALENCGANTILSCKYGCDKKEEQSAVWATGPNGCVASVVFPKSMTFEQNLFITNMESLGYKEAIALLPGGYAVNMILTISAEDLWNLSQQEEYVSPYVSYVLKEMQKIVYELDPGLYPLKNSETEEENPDVNKK